VTAETVPFVGETAVTEDELAPFLPLAEELSGFLNVSVRESFPEYHPRAVEYQPVP
jgi:hypothetical protein